MKGIIKACAIVFCALVTALNIFAKIKKNKLAKDKDLQKDCYDGAGKPVLDSDVTFYESHLKRAIDVVLSSIGLVVLSPVFLIITIAIFVDDPGPILFEQKRVGINKTYFKLYKFRSMKMSTPHDMPTHMLADPDQYITRIGKILRKLSLDELPQFFNILVGDLSIVGPRPALWNQADLVAERDKYGANDVMPGLTGWAQINGRDELEIPVKAKFDGDYVEQLRKSSISGMVMDAKCFFGTILSVLKSDGVVEGGTGELHKVENGRDDIPDTDTQIGFGEPVEVDFFAHKKVLITGANSYIGEYFEKYAKEKYNANFEIDTVDMIDGSWRKKDFSGYDTVFHVAGIAHADVGNVSEEVKQKYYAVNTELAIETAKKAKEDGVKQFVFMSSMIVYGDSAPYGKQKMITAETKPEPSNFYGDSKWQADKGVRALADEDFNVLVLRPPMIYGKGSKGNYPTLAKLAKKLPVFPDVENQRSMLYVENLCEFLCQVMLVGKGGIFFPQNEEYTKTADIVAEISKVVGKKVIIVKILNPLVWLGAKMPGKVGGLVNKAFGNSCYLYSISCYEGIDYKKSDLKHSILRTEGKKTEESEKKKT
ncbi:MAG: sugar transferase, partial [Lachnospiraceae bacterium]|nr:sugar transferase [Lachnospiraceae bacterium]